MTQHWLKPKWDSGQSISNLSLEYLLTNGIKALVLDVDGTLLPRNELLVHSSVNLWIQKAQVNFIIHLASNNPSRKRIETIGQQLNIEFTYRAAKPSRNAIRRIQEKINIQPS